MNNISRDKNMKKNFPAAVTNTVDEFLGIPYAASPEKTRRFKVNFTLHLEKYLSIPITRFGFQFLQILHHTTALNMKIRKKTKRGPCCVIIFNVLSSSKLKISSCGLVN